VLSGAAEFQVAGQTIAAPAGTFVRVDFGVPRAATASAPNTTVLVVGAHPGAALPPSPFEYRYAAQPAYDAGDYARAIEISGEGLEHYSEHGGLNYQLACYHALAGDSKTAARPLEVACAAGARARQRTPISRTSPSRRSRPPAPLGDFCRRTTGSGADSGELAAAR
jgi:hypothetical protein